MTSSRTAFEPSRHLDGLIAAISDAQSAHEILRRLMYAGQLADLPQVSILALPPLAKPLIAPQMIVTSFPDALAEAFDLAGYGQSSPNFVHFRTSTLPFLWHLDITEHPVHAGKREAIVTFLRQYELNCGVECIALNEKDYRVIVGFYGARDRLADFSEAAYFQQLTQHAVDRLGAVLVDNNPLQRWLTERELQCLDWSAKGKTSADIAIILSLSVLTVNNYLASATGKLNATSRTHAVAEAVRRRLI